MARHRVGRDIDPLSNRAIRAHAGEQLRDLWKTQLVGSVVVAIIGFALAWVVSGFSKHVWSQVTNAVVFPLAAVVLWLIGSGLWHFWRAPLRLAREHVSGINEELAKVRQMIGELHTTERNESAVKPLSIGPSPFPRTPLERTIMERIGDAEVVERERPVRGDGWYLDAVVGWAGDTAIFLRGAKAGDLAVEFEKGGIEAPVTAEKTADYMAAKIQLLRDALNQLRSDELS